MKLQLVLLAMVVAGATGAALRYPQTTEQARAINRGEGCGAGDVCCCCKNHLKMEGHLAANMVKRAAREERQVKTAEAAGGSESQQEQAEEQKEQKEKAPEKTDSDKKEAAAKAEKGAFVEIMSCYPQVRRRRGARGYSGCGCA